MKAKELREKDIEELKNLLGKQREKLLKTRFQLAMGRLKNVREIRKIKKDIARILTILSEKMRNSSKI